jgi:hypothetical protein
MNDPRLARRDYAAKLEPRPATEEDVLTSGAATAVYHARHERVEWGPRTSSGPTR